MTEENKKIIADKFLGTRQKKENKLNYNKPTKKKNEMIQKTFSLYQPHLDAIEEAKEFLQELTFKKVDNSAALITLFMAGFEDLKSKDPKLLKRLKMILLENM